MANFKPNVLKSILANEGGYVNDPVDPGGETWAGVARNINPKWRGWQIIDAIKKANPVAALAALQHRYAALNTLLSANVELAGLVAVLYESLYWDVNSLDLMSDQQLAANVCDCGVNCGTFTGAKMLQRAANEVIDTGRLEIAPLIEDGKVGSKTIAVVNSLRAESVYIIYNELRKAYYEAIIAKRPAMAKYRKSWFSRIIPYKA